MLKRTQGESGNVIVLLALFLMLLICFCAFGTEAGRWFLLRAEMSKSVDAAALVGAKNISNPHVSAKTLAEEYCVENFPSGYLGTPGSGQGTATFNVELLPNDKVQVQGRASSTAIMAQLLGITDVPVSSAGVAQKRPVEIMMVLDRSGSMSGQPMADLKLASKSFLDYFLDTQDKDKVGMVSFATSVRVDRALGTGFVAPMKAAIDAMNAQGATNPEDAIDQADGPSGFTDQSGVPPDSRVQQFMIFFSDGRPTAFRGRFRNSGNMYDAVACVTGNCGPGEVGVTSMTYGNLGRPDREQWLGINPTRTGNGLGPCGSSPMASTKWYALEIDPVPGYGPEHCGIPPQTALAGHVCLLASAYALDHAQELKDKDIVIFAIGIGGVNPAFLEQLATSPEQVYYAPNSSELQALFQKVAQEIKLRLVQ